MKSGSISGTVKSDNDQPVPGATVVLIPQFAGRDARFEFHRVTYSDQNGQFIVRGLSPGEYTACAWFEIESEAWIAQPELVRAAGDKARRVTVREDSQETLALKAIRLP